MSQATLGEATIGATASGSVLRIVLVQPEAGVESSALAALRGLDEPAEIDVVHDAEGARRRAIESEPDLVVVDAALASAAAGLLEALRAAGCSVLLVAADANARRALASLGEGAADAVACGPDLAVALPRAVRDQVRRHRAEGARARAEQQAARADRLERTYAHVLENLSGGVMVLEPDGTIRFANAMAGQILGAAAEALTGRNVFAWFRATPREVQPLARTLREGAAWRGVECVVTRADGAHVPVGLCCAPLDDSEGEGAVAILQDLSELKQLQRQVLQTEKMASIGQLAAGIAHEINNPMGFIHANLVQLSEYVDEFALLWQQVEGFRKLALDRDAAATAGAAEALGSAIEKADADYLLRDLGQAVRESLEGSERIRHIVQDLRAFAHQDAAESVETDLNHCLDSTANIVWTMMKHSVVLTKKYAELPPVRCRPQKLKQVFMNLLVNAYQAIEMRGSAAGARGEIRLCSEPRGDGVTIRVEDDGVGIPPEHIDRIFDPFFTTKQVGSGMGLGLSTSYQIVQSHGGTLRVESELGRGTRFEVHLPCAGRSEADA